MKLTPNCADPAAVALAAQEGGADAVSLINTVRATALDAADEGFETTVLLDLAAGVAPETTARALAELASAGVETTGSPG